MQPRRGPLPTAHQPHQPRIPGRDLDLAPRPFPAKLAACAATNDPELWFSTDPTDEQDAITVCLSCPVREACLEWACEVEEGTAPAGRFGVFGGQTARQRAGQTPLRTCPCGATIRWHPTISAAEYARRQFCSRPCQARAVAKKSHAA